MNTHAEELTATAMPLDRERFNYLPRGPPANPTDPNGPEAEVRVVPAHLRPAGADSVIAYGHHDAGVVLVFEDTLTEINAMIAAGRLPASWWTRLLEHERDFHLLHTEHTSREHDQHAGGLAAELQVARLPGLGWLDELLRRVGPEALSWYRHMHQYPELSNAEHNTQRWLMERLREMSLAPQPAGGTGVVVDIGDGPNLVALRADIDALPLSEDSDLPFASTVDEVCHACGHDMHTAVMLGVARVLVDAPAGALPGRVRIIFQPAEETAEGAKRMIDDGVLDGVEQIFSLHVMPQFEVGQIGTRIGTTNFAGDLLTVTVTGRAGHGSRPYEAINANTVIGGMAVKLPGVWRRMVAAEGIPVNEKGGPLQFSFGKLQGGEAMNAIPAHGVLQGTLRSENPRVREAALRLWDAAVNEAFTAVLDEMIANGDLPADERDVVTVSATTESLVWMVQNDPAATELVNTVVRDWLGPEHLVAANASPGWDDFAEYTRPRQVGDTTITVPGVYLSLGIRRTGAEFVDLHNGRLPAISDPAAIPIGIGLFTRTVLVALNGAAAQPPQRPDLTIKSGPPVPRGKTERDHRGGGENHGGFVAVGDAERARPVMTPNTVAGLLGASVPLDREEFPHLPRGPPADPANPDEQKVEVRVVPAALRPAGAKGVLAYGHHDAGVVLVFDDVLALINGLIREGRLPADWWVRLLEHERDFHLLAQEHTGHRHDRAADPLAEELLLARSSGWLTDFVQAQWRRWSTVVRQRWAAVTRSESLEPLRERNYRLYLGAFAFSVIGSWVQRVAQDWLVLELTNHSSTALGLLVAVQFAPMLLSLWGGVLADRYDKRRILMWTSVGLGVSALAMGVLALTGMVQVWHVFVLSGVTGVLLALRGPSQDAFVAEMVGRDRLSRAISLNSLVGSTSQILGQTLGAVLISWWGAGPLFLVNAASFVLILAAFRAMKPGELRRAPAAGEEPGDRSVLADLRDGLRYVWQRPVLVVVLAMMALVGTLAQNTSVTLPLLAYTGLGGGPETFSALATAYAVGVTLGSLLRVWRPREPTLRTVLAAALAFGLLTAVSGLLPTITLTMVALLFAGALRLVYHTSTRTYVQLAATDEVRGRVMGLYSVLLYLGDPISSPLLGVVGDLWGGRAPIVIAGAASAVVAILAAAVLFRSAPGDLAKKALRRFAKRRG